MAFSDLIRNTMDAFLSKKYMADGLETVEDDVANANSKADSAVSTAANANNRVDDIIASNGSAESTEVIAGRHDNVNNVTYDNLGKRLDAHSTSLADKVNQSYVDSKLGSLGGTFIFKGSDTTANIQAKIGASVNDFWYSTDGNTNLAWNSSGWVDIGNDLKLGDGTVTPKQTNFLTPDVNLFDKSKVTNGVILWGTTGVTSANANDSVSDYIEVKPSTNYTKNNTYTYAFYDSNKIYINGDDTATPATFASPSNAKYIRCLMLTNTIDSFMIVEGSILPTSYVPYQYILKSIIPATNSITLSMVTSALMQSIFAPRIVTKSFLWKGRNVITCVGSGRVMGIDGITYRNITGGTTVTLDTTNPLAYLDLTQTGNLNLLKIDDWTTLGTAWFNDKTKIIIAMAGFCPYLKDGSEGRKYIVPEGYLSINNDKVYCAGGFYIIGNDDLGSGFINISVDSNGYTVSPYGVLCININSGVPVFENLTWNREIGVTRYTAQLPYYLIPVAYRDKSGLIKLINHYDELSSKITALQNSVGGNVQLGDKISGLLVNATTGMGISIGSGKANGIDISGITLTLDSLGASVSKTVSMALTSAAINIIGDYTATARYPTNIVVKNGTTTLVKDTDYTLTGIGIVQIASLVGNITASITYDQPMCRLDCIAVNTLTNAVEIIKGVESNNNPTQNYYNLDGKYLRLANVWLECNSIIPTEIIDVRNISIDGYTSSESNEVPTVRKKYDDYLIGFYSRINQLMDTNGTRTEPIIIGIIGDSTVQQLQLELTTDFVTTGWCSVMVDKLHELYPDAEIIYDLCLPTLYEKRNYPSQNNSKLKIHIYNYAQAGHTINKFMHDGDGHYDSNAADKYSFLYHNAQSIKHDLLLMCRTNSTLRQEHLKYNWNYGVGSGARDIYTSAPYNLTLHPTTDYDDVTNGLNYLIEDNSKAYVAELNRIYTDAISQNTDILFVGHSPDSIIDYLSNINNSINQQQEELMFRFARDKNIPFCNLYKYFRNTRKYFGIPPLLSMLPEGNVHYSILTHWILGNRIAKELFSNSEE